MVETIKLRYHSLSSLHNANMYYSYIYKSIADYLSKLWQSGCTGRRMTVTEFKISDVSSSSSPSCVQENLVFRSKKCQ